MYRCFILALLFTLLGSVSYGQGENNELAKARKKREQGLYLDATVHYKNYLKQSPSNNEVNTELAEMLFFEEKNYEEAYPYMKKVLTYEQDSISYYHALARIEHYFGNLQLAEKMYKALQSIYVSSETKPIIEEAKTGLKEIEYYRANKDKRVASLRVINMGSHVNSAYPEYVPVVDEREDFIMFTSRRKNQFNQFPDVEDDMFHEDMYMAKRNGFEFDSAVALPTGYIEVVDVGNSKAHESMVSISPDGKTLFMYKLGTLWQSTFVGGKWAAPVKIGKDIISKDYVNHASITKDGKTIYFTSEKKKANGNLDIYKTELKSDGTWTEAENLGAEINSTGNEQSPFISEDGKTLYFSSNGLAGFGGYDIYKSIWDGKQWSKPENMGMPYNSTSDDVFFYPKHDFTEGFFSSNRKGGIGSYDIYRFYFINVPSFDHENLVMINKKGLLEPSNTTSTIAWIKEEAAKSSTEKMFFRVNDTLVTDDTQKLEQMITSGKIKKLDIEEVKKCDTCVYKMSDYYTSVNPTNDNTLAANNTMFANNTATTNTATVNNNATNTNANNNANNTNNNTTNTSNVTSTASGEKLVVLYFDFDSDKLTAESVQKLEEVASLMSSNSNYKAAVIGRTDFMGVDVYNDWLSLLRARAAANYLKNKSIDNKRLTKVAGEGALKPVGTCKGLSCIDLNAKSRRVEIVLIP
ncbi:MAG: OmpA family protein [Bacteroidota bacterium]|nr:OmpA family protein [Bacteroidota bacterium]